MKTVSDHREEKNLKDISDEYIELKKWKITKERIIYIEAKIEEEKISIKDCLDQGFWNMAKSKIERIIYLQEKKYTLISK